MKAMTAAQVRRAFVDFFSERDHKHHPSASLIPHDPTLLFTVAGMVPFKPYFVGEETPPFDRAVTIQKCVRAGGKHNDLDEIGHTSRHLTFFEMLGNFSFGDYFKSDAIAWAWELVTEGFGLDPERLWVTVHLSDDEAEAIWRDQVGVPAERIQRLGEDNYWRMADVGPCGPCSEIFWDKGPAYGAAGGPAHGSDERYVEIWNLVFMQFESTPDGSEIPLPKPSIDTGLGLERTVAVLQGVDSVWETDEFVDLLEAAHRLTGVVPGTAERSDVSLRVIVDHTRSSSMLISDGVFPSNEDRGYVLRRIIRRAVRQAWLLGVDRLIMAPMVDATVEVMGDAWPDLVRNHGYIADVVDREERRFRETLRTGQVILDQHLSELEPGEPLSGDSAFLLHDTYGFPLEVTVEIASERGVEVDTEGFAAAMKVQQKRAKSARALKDVSSDDVSAFVALAAENGPTEFIGRAELFAQARVLFAAEGLVVLDRTPFYAASGGQIGDTGYITCEARGIRLRVTDTVYGVPGLHVHHTERTTEAPTESQVESAESQGVSAESQGASAGFQGVSAESQGASAGFQGVSAESQGASAGFQGVSAESQGVSAESQTVDDLCPGDEVTAVVDAERRAAIRRNHTATHILHWALRSEIGSHVKQQGSWVGPDRLRFDFSHYEALTPKQITAVENLVNDEVLDNASCRHFETTIDHAQQLGAIAFFGDKYGNMVRVLEAGRHSVELCGGTHVRALGDIGAFRIVSESSIGANLRRVEAITGRATLELLRDQHEVIGAAADALGVPASELVSGISKRQAEANTLRSEVDQLKRELALGRSSELAAQAQDGVVVAKVEGLDPPGLRELVVSIQSRDGIRAVVLGVVLPSGGAALAAAGNSEFDAGKLIAEAKKTIRGGGRSAPDLAVAGGADASRLDEALDQARTAAGIL